MRDSIVVDGETLVLNGMGIREATIFSIDVFIAGLYLLVASDDDAAIITDDHLKRLVIRFVRDVPTDGLADGLAESFGPRLASEVARFPAMLPAELTSGTVIILTHRPQIGLEVRIGRRRVGVIRGQRFSQAFFRFMIGPNPPNSGLKVGLLGGHCG